MTKSASLFRLVLVVALVLGSIQAVKRQLIRFKQVLFSTKQR
ncbi:hypothetical protein [Yersinia alsatica]|nr:hypothetical protein [Yersinia alsatica]